MKCPHCNNEITLSVDFVDADTYWEKPDFYEYVKNGIAQSKTGRFTVMCRLSFRNAPEGLQKLYDEGYCSRSSGCDVEWYKDA